MDKKIIVTIVACITGFFILVTGFFGIQYAFKQAEIKVAEKRVQDEYNRKAFETKACQELIAVFKGKIDDEERTRLMNATGDLERTRQVLLLICENRTSFWDSKISDVKTRFDKLTDLINKTKREGNYVEAVRDAEREAKENLAKEFEKFKTQKEQFIQNATEIREWSLSKNPTTNTSFYK